LTAHTPAVCRLVFHIFPAYGASRRALAGATLKLIASAFFLVQPLAGLIAPTYGAAGGAIGVPWSNFVGILFFHGGNCIDAVGMLGSFDVTQPLAWANWPVWGMWVYMSATWLLVRARNGCVRACPRGVRTLPRVDRSRRPCVAAPLQVFANGIFFLTLESPWGPGANLGDAPSSVEALQYGGASLLLIGSVIYTAWAQLAVGKGMATGTMTAPLDP
jgi:hypothetical protein